MLSKKTESYKSFSSEETTSLGKKLAGEFLKKKNGAAKKALVLALKGDLGAGKTTFTQGFLKGLGSTRRATSPTFVIMRRHPLKIGQKNRNFKNVFHIDAYRLKTAENLEVLGFNEIMADPRNVIIIEWAERARKILPKAAIWMQFRHGKKENERTIILTR